MLVKKLSKLHVGSTQIDKMSEALCINQFIVLNLHVYQKKKNCESVSVWHNDLRLRSLGKFFKNLKEKWKLLFK